MYMDEENPSPDHENALSLAKQKTRDHARKLWTIIKRYSSKEDASQETTKIGKPAPEKFEYYSPLLTALKFFPYLLASLFGLSFFWDFNQLSLTIWGLSLQFEGLLKIISVSGLIGFLTNWLAITMLFKPVQKRPLLGHGLIPAQKNRIAYRIAQAVSDDLINPEIIKRKVKESDLISRYRKQSTKYMKGIIDDPNFREELKQWVVLYLDEILADPEIRGALAGKILTSIEETLQDKSFERAALKAYSFVKGQQMQLIIEEALENIPKSIESGLDKVDDLLDQLPAKIDEQGDVIEDTITNVLYKLINRLDVHTLVEDNLRSYDEQKLADIIQTATNEQLRYIQYLGAVLGLIGGFIIWKPLISLIVLMMLSATLLLADHLLLKQPTGTR